MQLHDEEEPGTNDQLCLGSLSAMLAENQGDLKTWLLSRPCLTKELSRAFSKRCLKSPEANVDISPLGFLLANLVEPVSERVAFCKRCQFWPGYVKSLRLLDSKVLTWCLIQDKDSAKYIVLLSRPKFCHDLMPEYFFKH